MDISWKDAKIIYNNNNNNSDDRDHGGDNQELGSCHLTISHMTVADDGSGTRT